MVTLALPDVLRRYDVSITTVAWVLTAYNLVLAARGRAGGTSGSRRRPVAVCAVGARRVRGVASLACGLAPSFGVLLAGRCRPGRRRRRRGRDRARPALRGRAVRGGAAHDVGARRRDRGGARARGRRRPDAARRLGVDLPRPGAAGAAAAAGAAGACGCRDRSPLGAAGPPARPVRTWRSCFGSAALSAALFLLVILLVNGWIDRPRRGRPVVTLMPLAAIAAGRVARAVGSSASCAPLPGFVLIAGGLAGARAAPPRRLGLDGGAAAPRRGGARVSTVAALTEQALAGRAHQAVHGGWTIASRHAGIVLGLVVLTPVFAHELTRNQEQATRAGAAIVLDSSIEPLHKIGVARESAADDRRRRRPPPRRPTRVRRRIRRRRRGGAAARRRCSCRSSWSAPSRARSARRSCSPRSSRSAALAAVAVTEDGEP